MYFTFSWVRDTVHYTGGFVIKGFAIPGVPLLKINAEVKTHQ